MKRIGIGIIGGGGIAAEGHICGYQLDPRCEVVALWDADEARVQVHVGPGAGQTVFHLHWHIMGGQPG